MPSSSLTIHLDDTVVKEDNDRENDNNHDHDDDHNDDDDRNDDGIERLMVPVDPATGVGSSKRKLSTVTLLGISIGILFTVVVGMSFAFATNNKNKGSGHKREVISAADGTGDVTTTIVYEEVDPPLVKEDEDAEAETSLDDENDPRNEMVTGKGLAEIPVGLVDFIKKVVSVPAAGRGRHSINIPRTYYYLYLQICFVSFCFVFFHVLLCSSIIISNHCLRATHLSFIISILLTATTICVSISRYVA